MPNVINVPVDGVDDLLNAGMYGAGAVVRVESATTEAGTYASVGTAALVSGTSIYTIYHTAGTTTDWYRTRFENAGGTVLSAYSDPFQAGVDGGYLCSLYDVKQRLGIGPSNTASDEQLLEIIRTVSTEIERVTECDFTGDRSDAVYVFDMEDSRRVLRIPRGIQSVTTLELATVTGGSYTATTSYYLRPADREWIGEPANRVELYDEWFSPGYETIRLTGRLGWSVVPPEVDRIAQTAVVAQWMTKGSKEPRAVIGPDGRTTILRDISPADWATLMRFRVPVAV